MSAADQHGLNSGPPDPQQAVVPPAPVHGTPVLPPRSVPQPSSPGQSTAQPGNFHAAPTSTEHPPTHDTSMPEVSKAKHHLVPPALPTSRSYSSPSRHGPAHRTMPAQYRSCVPRPASDGLRHGQASLPQLPSATKHGYSKRENMPRMDHHQEGKATTLDNRGSSGVVALVAGGVLTWLFLKISGGPAERRDLDSQKRGRRR